MSTPREELHALIEAMPERVVADLLADLRVSRSTESAKSRGWPPSWFGAGQASRPDLSERIDEILRDEFGRCPA